MGADVQGIAVGDLVSAETHIPCGHCYQCRTGKPEVCRHLKILGVDTDGAFAEYVALPEVDVWKNDPTLPLEWTAIQEPLGNAIDTVTVDARVAPHTSASKPCLRVSPHTAPQLLSPCHGYVAILTNAL